MYTYITLKSTLRLFVQTFVGLALIIFGKAEKVESKFNKSRVCEQTYGTTLTVSTNTRSYLACTSLCGNVDSCRSVTYNPDSKTCKTNSGSLVCQQTSECTPNIYYGEKKSLVKIGPNGCWTPIMNVRLCDGGAPDRGRLEVYHNNKWGTVCDDMWHSDGRFIGYYNDVYDNNAKVVCNMLGYGCGVSFSRAYYGQGSGPIWMDDVDCTGTEASIFDCSRLAWGQHNCVHGEDISVICS